MRPGYKQTEIGVIPEDWEPTLLDSIAKRGSGHTPDKKHPEYWNGNIKWISLADSPALDRVYIADTFASVTPAGIANSSAVVHPAGTVVLSRDAGVGKSAIMLTDMAVSQHFMAWRCGTKLDNFFLYYWLQSAKPEFERIANGSTILTIGLPYFRELKVAHPPLPEQRAIAGALSDADALIDSLEQLIAKKRLLKQGAMQDLLTGKKRLPGFEGVWEKTTLLRLADGKKELFDDGDWIEAEHITTKGIRLIQTGNIGIGRFEEKELKKYIFKKSFISLQCKQLRKGDLLICRLAEPAGRACVLPDIGEDRIVTSVDVTIFRPPESVADRVFLANLFSTSRWFKDVGDQSGGTTHKRISRGALGRLEITIPSLPEQTAIAAILSDMDAEIAALESKLAKARQVKQGMMQELLTGKTRLV
jgi:type I restriction enzyme S subunit